MSPKRKRQKADPSRGAVEEQQHAHPSVPWLDPQTAGFVLLMKLFLLVFVVVVYSALTNRSASFPYGWLERWNQWDAPHYLDIARDGYVTSDLHTRYQRFWIVFYPLYPWTVRVVGFAVRDVLVSAHLVSLAGAIATALIFQRLVELDFDPKLARSAVVFMFIFPTAYFFHAGYTESLFMVLALGCVLAARKRRWDIAAILGALASLTRLNGLLLIPVLLVEAFMQYRLEGRRFQRGWAWIPLAGLGFIIYLWVNAHVWNDPFYFQRAMEQYWGKKLTWPWVGIGKTLSLAVSGSQIRGTQELCFIALGLVCTVWCWRRLRPSYAVWMTLNWLLITSTTIIQSTPRYLLSFFPIFILFALLAEKRPFAGLLLTIWSLTFLGFFAGFFGVGKWAF